MLATIAQTNRWVQIPPGFSPGWFRCPVVDPNVSARCLNDSPPFTEAHDWFISAATYQPLPYLVPAAISRIGVHPDNLDRLMRAGKALISLLLLGAAIFLLWSSRSQLASLVRPGCRRYADGGISIRQPESKRLRNHVCSCLHQRAAPSHREETEHRFARWAWVIVAVSGFVLALSRTTGPVWIILSLAVTVPIAGVRTFLTMTLKWKRWSGPALFAVFLAILLNRWWEYPYGIRLAFDLTPLQLKPHGGTYATTAAPDGTNRRVQPPRVCDAMVGLRALAGARCGARGYGFACGNQAATFAPAGVDRSGSCGPGASGRRNHATHGIRSPGPIRPGVLHCRAAPGWRNSCPPV